LTTWRSPRKKPATYEDLLAVPEPLVAELVDDELFTSPRPAAPHAVALSNLTAELVTQFGYGREDRPGGVGHSHRARGGWRLEATHEGDTVVNAPPFAALALDLTRLWAR
jgi:hypothetical protein